MVAVEHHHRRRGGADHRLDHQALVADALLQLVQVAAVAVHAQVVVGLPAFVEHRRHGQLGQVQAVVLAPVDQHPGPRLLLRQPAPQRLVDQPRRGAVGQQRLVLADRFLAAVAGGAAEGVVGVEDVGLEVGDGNGDGCMLRHLPECLG
ncbi:hypothetical protein D3C77_636660 [compost metagenome]